MKSKKGGHRQMVLGFSAILVLFVVIVLSVISIGGYFIVTNLPQYGGSENVEEIPRDTIELSSEIKGVIEKKIKLIETLAADAELIKLVESSSNKNSTLTTNEIKKLDDTWQNSNESSDFIKPFLENDVALILIKFQEDHHEFPEIFVTDKVGLNVGQTNKTSDYYQADEEWWTEAYATGTGLSGHGEIEYDDSAKSESIALYVPIYDKQKRAIGVVKAVLSLSGIKREL